MNAFRAAYQHAIAQPFISATGFAALVHSTWTLGTLFSGPQPASPAIGADTTAWLIFILQTAAWHIPAFAIAFALDVGQIVTSHDIRRALATGQKPTRKYATFGVFAVATYYLQWMYCAHHFPLLDLGAGVSDLHTHAAYTLRDLGVWIIPALLPLSTFMYTFSQSAASADESSVQKMHIAPVVSEKPAASVQVERPAAPALPAQTEPMQSTHPQPARANPTGNYTGEASGAVQQVGDAWVFTCPRCGASKSYERESSAVKAAAAHIGRYCMAIKAAVQMDAEGGAS